MAASAGSIDRPGAWGTTAALAGRAMRRSCKTFHVDELGREYNFTDTDGTRSPPFTVRDRFSIFERFENQSHNE